MTINAMLLENGRKRVYRLLLISAVLLVPMLSGCTSPASSACAAPTISVSSPRLQAGENVTLTGENFIERCLDTDQGTAGDATKIPIVFAFAAGSPAPLQLTVVDADRNGHFEVTVTVPEQATVGDAEIRVGAETTVRVEIIPS